MEPKKLKGVTAREKRLFLRAEDGSVLWCRYGIWLEPDEAEEVGRRLLEMATEARRQTAPAENLVALAPSSAAPATDNNRHSPRLGTRESRRAGCSPIL